MGSEVKRLMEEIEQRCQAARSGLDGYAEVARHAIIERRFAAIGECQEELEKLVGREEAASLVVQTYIRIAETKK